MQQQQNKTTQNKMMKPQINTFRKYCEHNKKNWHKICTYYTRSIQQTIGKKLLHVLWVILNVRNLSTDWKESVLKYLFNATLNCGRLLKILMPAYYALFWKHERLAVGLWKWSLFLVLTVCIAEFVWKCSWLLTTKAFANKFLTTQLRWVFHADKEGKCKRKFIHNFSSLWYLKIRDKYCSIL
jgi:hypothetical protein